MGKLIVIDGVDGSGKQTQAQLLHDALQGRGESVRLVHFPDYAERSSALVRMYLEGEFGTQPEDVSPYAASAFYAVDRYASYVKHWREFYLAGGTVIADRYTTSNAIHQAGKLAGAAREQYLDWLFHFEYSLLELPRPDVVLFLDMPPEVSGALIDARYKGDGACKDIHERDAAHLRDSYEAALYACGRCGWKRVYCSAQGAPRAREDIAWEILSLLSY